MKVKMNGLSSLKTEAKRLGVSEQVVRDYQAARRAWNDRVRWYAKKYGGIESGNKAIDIRNIGKYAGENVEEFLRSRIETLKSRTSVAARYLRGQQQRYILSIIERAESSGADILTTELLERLNEMSNVQLGEIISNIGTSVLETYYELSDDGSEDEANEYLYSQVQRIL